MEKREHSQYVINKDSASSSRDRDVRHVVRLKRWHIVKESSSSKQERTHERGGSNGRRERQLENRTSMLRAFSSSISTHTFCDTPGVAASTCVTSTRLLVNKSEALDNTILQHQHDESPDPFSNHADSNTNKVVLNVGGQLFATSLSTLTRIPNTFFSSMFSGRWPLFADHTDGSYFIDRSSRVFLYIMEYMRGEHFDVDLLSANEQQALRRDADFYGLVSLRNILDGKGFLPANHSGYRLSHGNSVIERMGDIAEGRHYDQLILGTEQYVRHGVYKWRVRIVRVSPHAMANGFAPFIGVAPAHAHSIFEPPTEHGNAFPTQIWLLYCGNGRLCSGPPLSYWNKHWKGETGLAEGDVIGVALSIEESGCEGSMAFSVNGVERGEAFRLGEARGREGCCCVESAEGDEREEREEREGRGEREEREEREKSRASRRSIDKLPPLCPCVLLLWPGTTLQIEYE